MAINSKIEWTEATWNPVTGCSQCSEGCRNCYAKTMAKRLQAMRNPRYRSGFAVTLHEDLIGLPKRWKAPKTIFVNSMSDLFHEKVPLTFIQRVFETMANCPQHRFQVLTKRNDRLRKLAAELPWPDNVWMGVSVENARVLHRVDDLRTVPAAVRFLSCEPLLGSLAGINLADIHWVIAGGESGLKSRPMDPAWPLQLRDDCEAMDVPFFFKQWGGVNKKAAGRILDGMTYSGMPENGVSEEGQDSPDATGARSNDRSAQQPEDFLEENEVLALDGLELREQCTGGTAAKEPCRVPDCRQLLVLSIDMLITLEWR